MTERVLVSMPLDFLEKVDEFCEKNDYKRSELIRHALRQVINKKEDSNESA